MKAERERERKNGVADTGFVRFAADFFKNYADRLHHGKEEDILFAELAKKELSAEHSQMLGQLIAEHKIARENVAGLLDAAGRHERGEKWAIDDMSARISLLIMLYPPHIEMEDRRFFAPVMKYFTDEEKERLLSKSVEFDRKMGIGEKYISLVEEREKKAGKSG